jgi:hypothetical protein
MGNHAKPARNGEAHNEYKEWKVVPVQCGPGQFFVLVDHQSRTRAQGVKSCARPSGRPTSTTMIVRNAASV